MLTIIALVAFGVLTGILSGVLGVGGGIFMVPFLVLVIGLSQHAAQATSLLVVLPTAAVGSWALYRSKVGDPRMALRMGLVGMVGSVGGTALALSLPGHVLRIVFALLMVVVGVRLLRDAVRGPGV
ncbi:MAG: rane protein [Conexibacter sp.]|jgi:hypothetical protein|nr:rane protein [Conexibacter sp.]MCZ4491545.1 rane protein [Conexibacter sp.]